MARAVAKSWLIKTVSVNASWDRLQVCVVGVVTHMRRPSRSKETGVVEAPSPKSLLDALVEVLYGASC